MSRIRQVLRLYAAGNGTKTIANMLDVSRNTSKKYIRVFNQSGMTMEEVLALDDKALYDLFRVDPDDDVDNKSPKYKEAIDLMPEYSRRLKKKGMTRTRLYEEYLEEHPNGYSRSRFFGLMRMHSIQTAPVAHIEHKAGDKMYIDYAGDKLYITNKETGEKIPIEIFVAILPCSQLTYVEAVMSQKKEDLIKACENAFYYYGGTPQVIVPDNLKAAVSHPNKYESELNEDFAAFAEHYGCAVLPARVRRPKDKALVEGAVKLIYRTIYPHITGEYYDLESMNIAIRVALEIHNSAKMTGRNYSRREQYEEVERCCMGPINPIKFQLKKRGIITVQRNGHIRLDKHFYSVPVSLIGKKVTILYDSNEISIFHKFECVAHHKIGLKPYGYTTCPEHLPKSQQNYLSWDPDRFLEEAAAIDPDVKSFLEKVIEARRYPEMAIKSCQGILSLEKKCGADRLIKACRLAAVLDNYSYTAVEHILVNRQENTPLTEDAEELLSDIPDHQNIRGKEYYK